MTARSLPAVVLRRTDPRLVARATELLRVLGTEGGKDRTRDWPELVREALDPENPAQVWLALAVLTAQLPDDETTIEVARRCALDGVEPVLTAIHAATSSHNSSRARSVRIAVDEVVVDVGHTAGVAFATGIQRVALETVRRWVHRGITVVGWTADHTALRELRAAELKGMNIEGMELEGTRLERTEIEPSSAAESIVVPWDSTYVVPELAVDRDRNLRQLALARHTPNRTGSIGFDLVPLTSAETTFQGFAGVFAVHLAAIRHFDRVATISAAAGQEYGGWRRMLGGIGVRGPEIQPIPLGVEAAAPSPEAVAWARHRLLVGTAPLVLVVGSHEPRKNHLAVLSAAERLWRKGLVFSLSFVGGRAWGSEDFEQRILEMHGANLPVESLSGVSDDQLAAAYTLARCTIFPSFNEGFGLPVAESLAHGTPVVTSKFGSMAEIAAGGGALLVDPRDDGEIVDAMRALLSDDQLHGELVAAALARPVRSWDTYADEVFDYLVRPALPAASAPIHPAGASSDA